MALLGFFTDLLNMVTTGIQNKLSLDTFEYQKNQDTLNREERERNNQLTMEREDSQYQRLVADAVKAGINPSQIIGNGGIPSGNLVSPSAQSGVTTPQLSKMQGLQSTLNNLSTLTQLDIAKKTAEADINLKNAEAEKLYAETSSEQYRLDSGYYKSQADLFMAQTLYYERIPNEKELDRNNSLLLADKKAELETSLQKSEQEFNAIENEKNRENSKELQKREQDFYAAEAVKDKEFQNYINYLQVQLKQKMQEKELRYMSSKQKKDLAYSYAQLEQLNNQFEKNYNQNDKVIQHNKRMDIWRNVNHSLFTVGQLSLALKQLIPGFNIKGSGIITSGTKDSLFNESIKAVSKDILMYGLKGGN